MAINFGLSKLILSSNWSDVKSSIKNALKAVSDKVARAGLGLLESSAYVMARSPRDFCFDREVVQRVCSTPPLKPQLPASQEFKANFRTNGFVLDYFKVIRGSDRLQTTDEVIQQIHTDAGRYDGLTNVEEIKKAVNSENDLEIRQNILFGCCQKLELAVKEALHLNLYGENDTYGVVQVPGPNSKIDCNTNTRTTTLTSQLKVRQYLEGNEIKIVDTFVATATFSWDSADINMQITRPQ